MRNARPGRRKDSGPSKSQHKRTRVDANKDVVADSGGEVDVAPKLC